ncbi:MAG: endonuclease/exonuclease/phosphatase family protein [Chthoniobacterales bacterium]
MKRGLVLLIVVGLFAGLRAGSLCAQAPTPPSQSIRIAYWNIKWFPGGRPNAYQREEAKQIRSVHHDIDSLGADIIGLEEVRDFENAGLAVQPLPGFKVDVCSNFPPRTGQTDTQQIAITSRLQPLSAWAESWNTGNAITPPRGFAFAAYELPAHRLLLVYAVHLKSNLGELVENIAIRQESIRQLLAHMESMRAAYGKLGAITWVVGGDFNTAPDDPRFQGEKTSATLLGDGFRWAWANIPLAQRLTMQRDQRYPIGSFDHIFYRGAGLTSAEVLPTSPHSSDHRAIRVELALD